MSHKGTLKIGSSLFSRKQKILYNLRHYSWKDRRLYWALAIPSTALLCLKYQSPCGCSGHHTPLLPYLHCFAQSTNRYSANTLQILFKYSNAPHCREIHGTHNTPDGQLEPHETSAGDWRADNWFVGKSGIGASSFRRGDACPAAQNLSQIGQSWPTCIFYFVISTARCSNRTTLLSGFQFILLETFIVKWRGGS